jgi:hypothetical protein
MTDERPPRKHGTCDWCGRTTTVYAYALWVCRRCLDEPLENCTACGKGIFEGQRVRDYAGCRAHYGCVPA